MGRLHLACDKHSRSCSNIADLYTHPVLANVMPSATSDAQTVRIPAWKRLGLKLKSAQDTTATESPKDVETPKRKRLEESEEVVSVKKVKKSKPSADNPITPNLVRKKSVT